MYVSREILEELEPPFLDLHAAEWTGERTFEIRPAARRFENWETNFAGKVGLGVAMDYALEWSMEEIQARVRSLAENLRFRLWEIPGVTVRNLGKEKCDIVTFTVEGKSSEYIMKRLSEEGMNTSVSLASSTLLDMSERELDGLVRASVYYYNTEEEIDRFCEALFRVS